MWLMLIIHQLLTSIALLNIGDKILGLCFGFTDSLCVEL